MKGRLAMALWLIAMVAFLGVAVAANIDATATDTEDEDAYFTEASGDWEQPAAVQIPAPVERTGQTKSYGRRDDGSLREGVTWPRPRFRDMMDGTVKDRLTGLIWLKNASCNQFWPRDTSTQNYRNWNNALKAANNLRSGYCGLTDDSVAGSWRLPNRKELESLIHLKFFGPALPNAVGTGQWTEDDPFSHVQLKAYWSSSTSANYTGNAWVMNLDFGYSIDTSKNLANYVWPVR